MAVVRIYDKIEELVLKGYLEPNWANAIIPRPKKTVTSLGESRESSDSFTDIRRGMEILCILRFIHFAEYHPSTPLRKYARDWLNTLFLHFAPHAREAATRDGTDEAREAVQILNVLEAFFRDRTKPVPARRW